MHYLMKINVKSYVHISSHSAQMLHFILASIYASRKQNYRLKKKILAAALYGQAKFKFMLEYTYNLIH